MRLVSAAPAYTKEMPIYTYKCRNDDHIWDVDHPMSVDNAVEEIGLRCPECGSDDIFKYLGNRDTLVIRFRGPGWAINDMALDRLGMPEATRNSPEARKRLFRD